MVRARMCMTNRDMQGYTAPTLPTDASSLVKPPPWHFAGHVAFFEFEARRPAELVPAIDGLTFDESSPIGFAFAFWHFWTDDGAELLDPVLGQFHEAFALLPCLMDGEPVAWCPFMWVDST